MCPHFCSESVKLYYINYNDKIKHNHKFNLSVDDISIKNTKRNISDVFVQLFVKKWKCLKIKLLRYQQHL